MKSERDSIAWTQAALLAFFDANARDLPWRKTRDPYAIWVSEIMLQQTRVETVIPYYGAFLEAFPTVLALAEAEQDRVLSRWSGLGYYRRARMLHEAARVVANEHGGALPKTAAELRALPGIGRYTAGAIASIAMGERAAIVDGNVVRVIARAFGIEEEVTPASPAIWSLAEKLADHARPGDVNQALMELGATVCVPTNPRCLSCPLFERCIARRTGKTGLLPILPKKRAAKAAALVALVSERDGAVLLAKRESSGLFGGMWEPPMIDVPALARDTAKGFATLLGRDLEIVGRGKSVRHVLTHRDLTVRVVRGEVARGKLTARAPYEALRWVRAAEMSSLGVSSLCLKTLRAAGIVVEKETGSKKKR